MAKIFYPSAEKLTYLLQSIHNREVALPDFQRDFVWEPRETEELIESISQNYPAGSLLRIKNSTGFYFAPREFVGSPALNGHAPSYLILDGQQRLTSLYQAFYGAGSHRYFINLGGIVEGEDLEDCVYYLRKNDGEKRLGTLKQQADELTFPFHLLFGGGGFEEWLDTILDLRPETGDERKALKTQLRDVRQTWLKPVEDYEFPMVTLAEDTSASAVCTIFETLNRTGVKLSVFDLLAARFWPDDVRLRDLWDKARADHPIIADYYIDPYYILQAVSLFTATAAPSCKRSDVLKMHVNHIKQGWQPVVKGLADMLQILQDDCGIILPQWMPYNTILVPAAAVLSSVANVNGPALAANRAKIIRWFWCSVFGQAYEKAPNSQMMRDYTELRNWLADDNKVPHTVQSFQFDVSTLRQVGPFQRAIYRGVIALLLRNGARDFHKGHKITAAMMLEQKIEDHHVFPQAYLNERPNRPTDMLRDCILNRTLIDKETNGRIGKRAPSDYLGEIKDQSHVNLDAVLQSHLLPTGLISPLLSDDFTAFLDQRQQLIERELMAVTGAGVTVP